MKLKKYMPGLLLIGFLTVFYYAQTKADQAQEKDQKQMVDKAMQGLPQVIKPVALASHYSFCGESLPMSNPDVVERLERELLNNSYMHSTSIQYLKSSKRYFPMIENILKQEGIPEDFKYLAVAESGLKQAVSPAGAKGIWQFMKGTANEYDLETNSEVDERYHVEKSTRAACRYIQSLQDEFGSWTLAAAAYNMGPTALRRELANQKEKNYYDLNLSQETMRYLFRIVAIKEILADPSHFGFYLEPDDYYPPYGPVRAVEVNSSVSSLADLAHEYGATYREMKIHNPWLLTHELKNTGNNTYYILLPKR